MCKRLTFAQVVEFVWDAAFDLKDAISSGISKCTQLTKAAQARGETEWKSVKTRLRG